MATDTKKKSESTAEDATSTIKVGGDSGTAAPHKPRRLTPLPSGKRKIFVALAIIAVLVGGALLLHGKVHIGEKVYAQAAGHKIYKQDVKNLIGNTKGVTDRQAATALADKYLLADLAKEQGISVTDKDIQAAYGSTVDLNKQKTTDKYSYQVQVNSAYILKLQSQYQGIYKGYVLVTHFSRYIPDGPVTPALKAAIPQMGDASAIASDKKYAQDLITALYNQIKAGKITWDQAAQVELHDPKVGTNMYPALSHSGPFDTSNDEEGLFTAPSARLKISSLKAGQTTKPFVVTVFNPETDATFESYFLVVRMDSSSGGHGDGNFQQYMARAKKRLNYQVNI